MRDGPSACGRGDRLPPGRAARLGRPGHARERRGAVPDDAPLGARPAALGRPRASLAAARGSVPVPALCAAARSEGRQGGRGDSASARGAEGARGASMSLKGTLTILVLVALAAFVIRSPGLALGL